MTALNGSHSTHRLQSRAAYIPLVGSNVVAFIGLFSLSPILPSLNQHFAGSPHVDALVQYIGAAASFSFAVACLFAGPIIGRHGYRRVYLASLALFGLAGSSACLVNNLYLIILSRVIVGIACAGAVNGALVATNYLVNDREQTRILGLQAIVGNISAIVMLPVIGVLASTGWRAGFLAHAIPLLLLPPVFMLRDVSLATPVGQVHDRGLLVAADRVGPLMCATAAYAGMAMFAISMFPPLFLFRMGVTDSRLLSIPPTAAVIGGVVGATLLMLSRGRISTRSSFLLVLMAIASGLLVMGMSRGVLGVTGGVLIAGIGSGAFSPILYAAAIKASPESPAPTLGVVNTILYGSMVLFPVLTASLSAVLGGARPMLMAFVAAGTILTVLFLASREG